jgi:hypothetical protein
MDITTALQIRDHQRAKIHVHQPSARRLGRRSSLRLVTAQFSELPTNTDNPFRRTSGIKLFFAPEIDFGSTLPST